MILGIGVDLLDINRIEKLYIKFGDNLAKHILSEHEMNRYKDEKNKILYLAKRFCIKEAFSKALGLGMGRGVNFSDITTKNDKLGKPLIELNEKSLKFIEKHFDQKIKIDLSLSDEKQLVNAFVVISKIC